MHPEEFLKKHLVFRFNEFKQFMESREQGITESNCYMALYNYCKKGKLTHIRKKLYAVNLKASSTLFFVAGKASDDAVLAYQTALESHGLFTRMFNNEHTYFNNPS